METDCINVLAIGDPGIGKESLIQAINPSNADEYISVVVGGKKLYVKFNTISGMELDDKLRQTFYESYGRADVVLLCFSTIFPKSLETIESKWMPEVQNFFPSARTLVVGNMSKLKDCEEAVVHLAEKDEEPVDYYTGQSLASDIGANGYVECSSIEKVGVSGVVWSITEQAMQNSILTSPI